MEEKSKTEKSLQNFVEKIELKNSISERKK
jgi:hypothetical protein